MKLSLINNEAERKKLQQRRTEWEERFPTGFSEKYGYNKTQRRLSQQWVSQHNKNKTLVRLLSHNIRKIARSWNATEIKFEDLRFSRHSPKRKVGTFLARWQIMWFFRQVQEHVKNRQTIEGYSFLTVRAKGTSQRCSRCGKKGKRKGKSFRCGNHTVPYRLDADLNAARNIARAPAIAG